MIPGTVLFRTMGCKINQYETQALREAWLAAGWAEVREPADAGVMVVNSCAVTAQSVRDLRTLLRRLHQAGPMAEIVVTGCAAQVLGQELATLPGVTRVVPQQAKAGLGRRPLDQETGSTGGFPALRIVAFDRQRAVCKVQDGCSHGCSYCIVPLTRGPSTSRPAAEVLEEIRRLLRAGHREIILAGINLAHYGRGLRPAMDFWDLLAGLDVALAPEWQGVARLRLSSLDPGQLTPKGLETLARCRLVCPHLHVALQSFSPEILRRMGRGHTSLPAVADFLGELRGVWPLFALGLDLLCAFPGEAEADVAACLQGLEAWPVSYAHVFPFSPRPGTPAARFPGRLPRAEAARRAELLRAKARANEQAFAHRVASLPQVGVILERPGHNQQDGQAWGGTCEYYLDCTFGTPPDAPALRQLRPARPTAAQGAVLAVEPVNG